MIGDAEMIEALRRIVQERGDLLQEMLAVLERGAEFQLGPKGRHKDLIERLRKTLKVMT